MVKIVLDKVILLQKYKKENKTMQEIANELDVSISTVRKNFRDYGIQIKPSSIEVLNKSILEDLYLAQLLSIRNIAVILNIPETQIRKSLKKHQINRRNKSWKSSLTKNGKTVACKFCGKLVYRKKYILEKYDIFFCSWKCANEYQATQGNFELPEGWRRRRDYRKWRKDIIERDSLECKMCKSNEKIVAHHIIEAQDNPDLKYELGNGITLCQKCHIIVHKNNSHTYIESLQKAISVANPEYR